MICQLVTSAPGMMHILDKPGSCGQFENYQRPDGFPVGMLSICYLWHDFLFIFYLDNAYIYISVILAVWINSDEYDE